MSLKIIKASAGSGKTYTLTREYITRLLASPGSDAYRHVLAVTFTNKATAEMKQRILSELHCLATDPAHSPYHDDIVPSVCADDRTAQMKAKAILAAVLYDYSSFAVSTIDAFFQKTLRAFAHETGLDGSYKVDLDREALVDAAVDRVMATLNDPANATTLRWITEGVDHDLATTGKYNVERRLRDLAMSLTGSDGAAAQILPADELAKASEECDAVVTKFVDDVSNAARRVADEISADGMTPADFNRAFPKSVIAYASLSSTDTVKAPSEALLTRLNDPSDWFTAPKIKAGFRAGRRVQEAMADFASLFGDRYGEYLTAASVRNECLVLRIATQLRQVFGEIQKEKNVVTIDRTNELIRDIVDGSDAPFIYEKLGIRFEDFLLDEFQDTSGVQYGNFLPLLLNGIAEGGQTLLVGDVKQSIYRWRGSDWELLGGKAEQELDAGDTEIRTLTSNYRSLPAVVDFNNAFFEDTASVIDAILGFDEGDEGSIGSIYGDVRQKAARGHAGDGVVNVTFTATADEEMDCIVEAVRGWQSKGMPLRSIAVLVRGNAEGQAVAARLLGEGIDVMSDEALAVKGSATVRRIVSGMTLEAFPERKDSGDGRQGVASFVAGDDDTESRAGGRGLYALAEALLERESARDDDGVRRESAFVLAFLDYVRDWSAVNGDNIPGFLRDWETADTKIAMPEGADAVRVMTIHKAKGLEFPVVIVPFLEKTVLYRNTSRWCRPKAGGTTVARLAGGDFCVPLSEASAKGLFRDVYLRERYLQAVDNINIAYVAMTRASAALEIIAQKPGKGFVTAFEKGTVQTPKDFAQILYTYIGGVDRATYGDGIPDGAADSTKDARDTITLVCTAGPVARKSRLVLRSDGTGRFQTTEPAADENNDE